MGLDITAHEIAELVDPHPVDWDSCYELGHRLAYSVGNWPLSTKGLVLDRCYKVSGRSFPFRAGSYGGYNAFRRELSLMALDIAPEDFWKNRPEIEAAPFYELINFADNEGTIGPEAAAKLAVDFQMHRKEVLARQARRGDPENDPGYFQACYDNWMEAFVLAAGKGLVDFH